MDPLTADIIGNRLFPPGGTVEAWQACPLRLQLSLVSGQNLDGATSIIVELHGSQSVAGDPPLAGLEMPLTEFAGPWTLDFSGAQMNQTVPEHHTFRGLWMCIIAVFVSADRLEVLATREIKLHRHNASLSAPQPPDPALSWLTAAQIAELYTPLTAHDELEGRVTALEETGGTGPHTHVSADITDASAVPLADKLVKYTPAGAMPSHTHVSADIADASAVPAVGKVVLYGADGGLSGASAAGAPAVTGSGGDIGGDFQGSIFGVRAVSQGIPLFVASQFGYYLAQFYNVEAETDALSIRRTDGAFVYQGGSLVLWPPAAEGNSGFILTDAMTSAVPFPDKIVRFGAGGNLTATATTGGPCFNGSAEGGGGIFRGEFGYGVEALSVDNAGLYAESSNAASIAQFADGSEDAMRLEVRRIDGALIIDGGPPITKPPGNANRYLDGSGLWSDPQGGLAHGFYRFATPTAAADPGSGQLRLNAATWAAATALYMDQLSDPGTDITALVELMRAGDSISIQAKNDSTRRARYSVTGAPTNNAGWFTIPVVAVSSAGAVPGGGAQIAVIVDYDGGGTGSPHTHVSADITDASDTGSPGKLVKYGLAGQLAASVASGPAMQGTSEGLYGGQFEGGVYGIYASSMNATGLKAESNFGAMIAVFSDGEAEVNRVTIRRTDGALIINEMWTMTWPTHSGVIATQGYADNKAVAMIAPPLSGLADSRGKAGDLCYDPATPYYLFTKVSVSPHKWVYSAVADTLP